MQIVLFVFLLGSGFLPAPQGPASGPECAAGPSSASNSRALIHAAQCYYERRDFRQALEHFQRSLAQAPDSPESLEGVGKSLHALGAARESIPYLLRALQRNPRSMTLRRTLAYAFADVNDFLRAEELLKSLITENPRDSESRFRLGELLYRNGFYGAALKHLEDSLAVEPNNGRAKVYRAISLVQLGRMPEAAGMFQALAADRSIPKDSEFFLVYAQLLYETGRPDVALERIDQALALSPDYTMAHFWRARVLLHLQRREEACSEAETAVRLAPDLPFARVLLVEIYRDQGRMKEAARLVDWLEKYEDKRAGGGIE